MWFKRINRVQLTALSPLNYHFHNECEMEKRFPLSDLRAKFEKSIIASFLARVARFLCLLHRRRKWPAYSLREPVASVTSSHEISVATTKSRGQCMPNSKRLPITPVAQISKTQSSAYVGVAITALLPVKPNWQQTLYVLTERQNPFLFASAYVETSEYPVVRPIAL